uniref:Uncharacterized protein n=1 Tax=Arundo donax TaxID=35708 RepID=A0A0A9D4C3_ARUDO
MYYLMDCFEWLEKQRLRETIEPLVMVIASFPVVETDFFHLNLYFYLSL